MFIFVIAAVVFMIKMLREDPATLREPYDLTSVEARMFPGIYDFQEIPGSKVRVGQVELEGNYAIEGMQVRVYVPEGWDSAAPGSLSAVLVAPAGTNLLTGVSLGELNAESYHDEALPYAEAGMVCVMYSLDGDIDLELSEQEQQEEFMTAYMAFKESMAGLTNSRDALEFVLEEFPKVDPEKIYAAGHSSAGTLALLFAMHEPRLAGCAAYAPCTDVAEFHEGVLSGEMIVLRILGVSSFLVRSSPLTHAQHLSCPLFLFHSKDDDTCDISQSERLIEALKVDVDVTFETVESGGHYDPMIQEGIPAAIEWMRTKDSQ